MHQVSVTPLSLERFAPLIGAEATRRSISAVGELARLSGGRRIWNISSPSSVGSTAATLFALVGYARGAGIDVRWLALDGPPEHFRIGKLIRHGLLGESENRERFGSAERALYEQTLARNLEGPLSEVSPGDLVVLHEPVTAGLAPELHRRGARVAWRTHAGSAAESVRECWAWDTLAPYLVDVENFLIPEGIRLPERYLRRRLTTLPPTIDPFSPKNQALSDAAAHAILTWAGLVTGPFAPGDATFVASSGERRPVTHCADVITLGPPPSWTTPLVVKVARWDRMKDHLGAMLAFTGWLEQEPWADVAMILAGPNVRAVADDPDAPATFEQLLTQWRGLPHALRRRVLLAMLPVHDPEENAAIVNALMHHAVIMVQKGLREPESVAITEAMWKGRAIIASGGPGIREQLEDGREGVLLRDARDPRELGRALSLLFRNEELRARLGERARERARTHLLHVHALPQYTRIFEAMAEPPRAPHRSSR